MTDLDETDRKMLALLQLDGQQTMAELSKALGAPASTLNDRVKRLIRQGAITGFHAHVAPEALGLDLLAFVFVGWSDPRVEPEFLRRVDNSPEMLECHHVTGAWNYLCKVRVKNSKALERFLADVVKDVPGLQRTETIIALSSAKETGTLSTDA